MGIILLHVFIIIVIIALLASGLLHFILMTWMYGWGFNPDYFKGWWARHLKAIFWTHVIALICMISIEIYLIWY